MVKTVDPSPPIFDGNFRNNNSSSLTNHGRRARSDSTSSEDSVEADQRAAEANRLLQQRYQQADERYKRARLAYAQQDEEADNLCIQRSFDPVSKDFADPDAFCYWRDDASNYMMRISDRFTWEGLLATPQSNGLISHPIYGAKYSFDPAFVMSIITAPMQMEHRNLLLKDKADYEGRKAGREELEDARKVYQLLHQQLFPTNAPPPAASAGHDQSNPLLLHNGTSERPFQPTTKWDSNGGMETRMDLQSITAMFTYQHYSFEELRLQDLVQGIRGNTPTSSAPTTHTTTEIPFDGAAGSFTEWYGGQSYFDAITGMNEYANKSFEELRLENLIAGRVVTISGLETIFDALDVGGDRMSDCTNDDQESGVVLQSNPHHMMSFEEMRFHDMVQ